MNEVAVAWIAGGAAVVSAALSSVVTLIVARRPGLAAVVTARATEIAASAAVQQAINDGFAKLNAGWETRVTALEGAVRDLIQHVESLEEIFRKNGWPIPARPVSAAEFRPFKVLEGDKVTTFPVGREGNIHGGG